MQALTTKYLEPTAKHGARIIAKCDAGKITVTYEHAISSAANHKIAAFQLLCKLEKAAPGSWKGNWSSGEIRGACVWVCSTLAGDMTISIR